jgi:cobalt-zinc-cadmium efflux system membrane fusion protein
MFRHRLTETVAPLLVVALLGGLLVWGHHTGWALPKFSALLGNGSGAGDDWCGNHSVPESICVECNPQLLPKLQNYWCKTHGVHACPFEHPEVAQLLAPADVGPADLERASRALALKERPENNSKCKAHERRLQLASADVMHKMGIDVAPVWRDNVVETITASGELAYEQPRVAPVYTPVAGRVWRIMAGGRLGAQVREGEVLALVDAVEVGRAKADFLQAAAQLDLRNKNLAAARSLAVEGAVSPQRLREAETACREAEISVVGAQQLLVNLGLPVRLDEVKNLAPEPLARHLQFLGIPAEIARGLDPDTTTTNLLALRAARDGTVNEVNVAAGERADPSRPLFVVVDTSRLWLKLHVRGEDAKYVQVRDEASGRPGLTVRFRPDGDDRDISGELVWKSTTLDHKTHTLQVRADIANPDRRLVAHTFGTGHIVLRAEKDAIVVPKEAVHWEGDCHVVFVRDKAFLDEGAAKVFHVRSVRPGVTTGGSIEIIAGLLPGEVVATRNSAVLRAELLKNNLGLG